MQIILDICNKNDLQLKNKKKNFWEAANKIHAHSWKVQPFHLKVKPLHLSTHL